MFRPDQAQRLQAAVASSSYINVFEGQPTTTLPVSLPSNQTVALQKQVVAGLLYPPERIFGTPFNASCMDGIGTWPVHAPGLTISRIDSARIIGSQSILSSEGHLYRPDLVRDDAGLTAALAANASGYDGYALIHREDKWFCCFGSRPLPRSMPYKALFFHNLESANYGSFFFRQLPQMMHAATLDLEFDCYVVGARTRWFYEACEILSLPPLPVFTIEEVSGEVLSSVYLYNEFDAEAFMSPSVTEGYRRLREIVGVPQNGPRNIYLSRSLSGVGRRQYRHMTNELEVEALLHEMDFKIVYPETLGFREQIRLMGNARCVIGPSGSAMFNVAFAEEGVRVVDIESHHTTVRQHAKFYASQKVKYSFVFSEMDPDDQSAPIFRRSSASIALVKQAARWVLHMADQPTYSLASMTETSTTIASVAAEQSVIMSAAHQCSLSVDGKLESRVLFPTQVVTMPRIELFRMPEGTLLLGDRHFVLSGETFIKEQSLYASLDELSRYTNEAIQNRSIEDVDGSCVLVVREGVATWGHWLGELLPKAVLIERAYPGRFKFCLLSVYGQFDSGSRWAMMRDSLLAYGITEDRAIPIHNNMIYRFKQLHALTPLWAHGTIHPAAGAAMREALNVLPQTNTRRILLLRNPEDGRSLSNHEEIKGIAVDRRFEPVYIGLLPFKEQVALFSDANAVLGVLGSSFTGLMYAPAGIAVVAMSPNVFGDRFFYGLTVERSGTFVELRGEVTALNEKYPRSSDFRIDPGLLSRVLDDLPQK